MAVVKPLMRSKKHRKRMKRIRYKEGYEEGYREGVQYGIASYPNMLEGTSIIIPTCNQLQMLRQCIDSIIENIEVPYEIIVVDNASTDETIDYLQQLDGLVRFRVLDINRGFAGAVNVGLMMSKGTSILLLNTDTLVTENGLENMLACLSSDDRIGMVGPVTNDISGEQRIDVPYRHFEKLPEFARSNNSPDPSRWRRTDRLTGFCLLFRRELFEAVGYFDERYENGNFEDDDYNVRVRMLGKSLVIAQDAFIHHFESVSIKALGEGLNEVNDRNRQCFVDKWNNPYEWIHCVGQHPETIEGALRNSASLYPEHVVVQGIGANIYWIENGLRRQVEGKLSFPVSRISQVDLRLWPLGEPIASTEVERRWRGQGENKEWEAGILMLLDGDAFHIEGDKVRRIAGSAAMQAWNLHLKPIKTVSPEVLSDWVEGLPIISPPILKQEL